MIMKPVFVERERIILAGYNFYGDPFTSSAAWTEENEIGRLWKRFMRFCSAKPADLSSAVAPGVGYEVHIWDDETLETGHFEVFVGMEIPAKPALTFAVNALPSEINTFFTWFFGFGITAEGSDPHCSRISNRFLLSLQNGLIHQISVI